MTASGIAGAVGMSGVGPCMRVAWNFHSSSPAKAQASGFPITTDRPSYSDGTVIIPKGRWQIESGYTFTKVDQAELQTFGEFIIRVPLQENLEVRLSNVTYGRANIVGGGSSGLLDPTIGVKYRFQTGVAGKSPDLGFVAQTTVPIGDRDFRVDTYQPTLKFIGYYQATPVTGFGWNVVWSRFGRGAGRFDQWGFGAYVAQTLNAKTAAFAELYHLSPSSKGGPRATFADVGLTYLLNQATQVDFRVGTCLNQRRDGWFFGVGISYRF